MTSSNTSTSTAGEPHVKPPAIQINEAYQRGIAIGIGIGFALGYGLGIFIMRNMIHDPLAEHRRRIAEGPPKGQKVDPEAKRRVQDMKFDQIIREEYAQDEWPKEPGPYDQDEETQ